MPRPVSRPNLVFFMPDQLRTDAVGCFGSPVAKTPSIDGLAARGVRFTDAWSQHSVCGPSRVSMFTGWYPHTNGHRTLDNLIKPWEPNLFAQLREAGYYVALAGNRGDTFAPGVTEASSDFCGYIERPTREAMRARYTSTYPQDHPMYAAMCFGSGGPDLIVDTDEAAVRTAETWLAEGAPSDQPWALFVPLIFPHPPFAVEEPWFSMHDRSLMPASIPASATKGKADFMDAYRDTYGWDALTGEHLAEIQAIYHGMVSRVDSQLGRVVDAVAAIGATDSTVVAFFTDHGEYLGDYGLVEKWPSGQDPSLLRNPLIMAGPGIGEGISVDQPVEMIDLLATCFDLAAHEPNYTHFGRSLLPVIDDPGVVHRPFACSEGGFRSSDAHLLETAGGIYQNKADLQRNRPELVGLATSIRTPTHTYVHRRYEDDELYDRLADPEEIVNIINEPGSAEIGSQLRDALLGWMIDTGDVIPWNSDPRFPDIPHGWREGSAASD